MSAKDTIITLPNKHLRESSQKIAKIDKVVLDVIGKMKQATLDWEDSRKHELGVALAAVQIDHMQRIVIIRDNFDDKSNRNFQIFINPEITKKEGEIVEDFEGCLSIKDVYGKVPRHFKVRIKALNEKGQEVRIKAEGFLARVFQHEIDHTNGIVYIDHIKNKRDNFYHINDDGKLDPLDYDESIKKNSLLW